MANQKISELTEDTAPAVGDFVPTDDISASATKKVTLANLLATTSFRDVSNLLVKSMTGNGVVLITADSLNVGGYQLSSVSLTLTMTAAAGINSIDTGTMAANTWYYAFVIYNPSTATTAALGSLSATAPTMPSGYTQKRRVGSFRATSTTVIRKFHTNGYGIVYYETLVAALSAGTQTSYTDVDCTAIIPPTSTIMYATTYVTDSNATAYMEIRCNGDTSDTFYLQIAGGANNNIRPGSSTIITDSAQIFEYLIGGASDTGYVNALGYFDNL